MRKLLSIGINSRLKDYQAVLVWNSNISAVILAVIAFIISLLFYINDAEKIGFGLIFFIPAVLTFVLNAIQSTVLSRVVLVVLTALLVVVFHAYFVVPGQAPLNYLFLSQFLIFLVWAILFDVREKVPALISLGVLVVLFLGFPVFNTLLNATEETIVLRSDASRIFVSGVNILFGLLVVFHLRLKKLRSDLTFRDARGLLDVKDEELKQQEKELQETLDEISKTHREDDKRNWISDGINQLNIILRNSDDTNLFNKILSQIIKYLKINQGGIYEIKENDFGEKFFAIKAVYGFEWARVLKTEIPIDDEGILGMSYRESAPVYKVEVPEEYSIESGLGKTKPTSIFVVPMVYEGVIEGMLELTAFKKLEDYEKEYILKAADIIARFIESYQVNVQSKELLEKTNQQTEEMRAQEEEMRQNMEELQATQEELHRKEREYIARIDELEAKVKA